MTLGRPPFDSAPAWLLGGRRGESARAWWRDLARNVDALVERYPRALADVPRSWWREADLAEQLGAVCAWRLDLDEGGITDPREELAFHEALERLRERLDHRARRGLLDAATPPAPPADGEDAHASALQADLGEIADSPDVSIAEAFLAPLDGRPGSHRLDGAPGKGRASPRQRQ